jgi:hypothetical protein
MFNATCLYEKLRGTVSLIPVEKKHGGNLTLYLNVVIDAVRVDGPGGSSGGAGPRIECKRIRNTLKFNKNAKIGTFSFIINFKVFPQLKPVTIQLEFLPSSKVLTWQA